MIKISVLITLFVGIYSYAFPQQRPAAGNKAERILAVAKADAEKGRQLVLKSTCIACHKEQEKLVGPSYRDIAERYPITQKTVDSLSKKIREGGSGVWGQIPMSPNPTVTPEEAKAMVMYVMSLKTEKGK